MKRTLLFSAAAVAVAFGASLVAQSVPEIAYDSNADAITLPSFGEVAGVATNSRGHLFVYARTGHGVATLGDERTFYHGGSRLFHFDQTGKFVKEIGQGTYGINFAQQVRVDPQDNIWVVDAGSNQVIKFDPDGKFVQVLGRKPESIPLRPGPGVPATAADAAFHAKAAAAAPAAAEAGRGGGGGRGGATVAPGTGQNGDGFSRPSDVAWDRAGNIYVADGYGNNNRIAKFNKDGDFLSTFGHTGSGQGEFNQIKGLVIDAAGNLYVADSGNKRIQVFDAAGKFKSQITGIGTPQAICITGGAQQVLFSSNSSETESITNNGEIYKIGLGGQVMGKFGKAGRLAKEFGMTNALDCRTDTSLWVGEVWNWRAQKVTLK